MDGMALTYCLQFTSHSTVKTRKKSNQNPLPHTDEDVSVTEDEEEEVLLGNVVKVGALLVGEEQVRFPETFEHRGINGEGIRLVVRR